MEICDVFPPTQTQFWMENNEFRAAVHIFLCMFVSGNDELSFFLAFSLSLYVKILLLSSRLVATTTPHSRMKIECEENYFFLYIFSEWKTFPLFDSALRFSLTQSLLWSRCVLTVDFSSAPTRQTLWLIHFQKKVEIFCLPTFFSRNFRLKLFDIFRHKFCVGETKVKVTLKSNKNLTLICEK